MLPQEEAAEYLAANQGNMLAALFAKQNDLDEEFAGIENRVFKAAHSLTQLRDVLPTAFGRPAEALSHRARQMYCANITFRVIVELVEMIKHLDGWKMWKRNPRPADPEKAQEEFIDALHFFIMLADYLGFDSNSLYKAYFDKASINATRQKENY